MELHLRGSSAQIKQGSTKDLGYANTWEWPSFKTPEIVERCFKLGHKRQQQTVGKCLTKVTCPLCGYHYYIDSSD